MAKKKKAGTTWLDKRKRVKEAINEFYPGEQLMHLVSRLIGYDGACLPRYLDWMPMSAFDEVMRELDVPHSAVALVAKSGAFDPDKDVFNLEGKVPYPNGYTFAEMTRLCEIYLDEVAEAVMKTGTDLEPGLQEVLDNLGDE